MDSNSSNYQHQTINAPLILFRPISGLPHVYTRRQRRNSTSTSSTQDNNPRPSYPTPTTTPIPTPTRTTPPNANENQLRYQDRTPNPNPNQEFLFFTLLPIEIRHAIWRLLRSPLYITTLEIPDPKQRYLYTPPYYANPLLRINQESRALALETSLYFLAPVDLLRVISHPSIQVLNSSRSRSGLEARWKGKGKGKQKEAEKEREGEKEEKNDEMKREYHTKKDIQYLTHLQDTSTSNNNSRQLSTWQQPDNSDLYTFPFLSPSPLFHLRIQPHKITYLAIDFSSWEFESSKPSRGNLHLVLTTFPNLKELVILLLDERSKVWARPIVTDDLEFLARKCPQGKVPVCRLLDVDVGARAGGGSVDVLDEGDFDVGFKDEEMVLGTAEVYFP